MTLEHRPPPEASGVSLPAHTRWRRLSIGGTALLSLVGLGLFLFLINENYAIRDWLLWRYVWIEAWVLLWATACLAAGHRIVLALRRHDLPVLEHVVVSFAVGVLSFYGLTAIVGFAGLLRQGYFVWGPLLLVAVGLRSSVSSGCRFLRHRAWQRRQPRPRGPSHFWVSAAGLLGLLAVWWCTLTPQGSGPDAVWYHLPLAEQYAQTGAIAAYREGWILGAYPHLASVLYTWAFLLPVGGLFEHVVAATQMEFVCACAAWASVGAIVHAALGRARVPGGWAFVWLFPASFLFLPCGGADMVAAMWAGPIFLCSARVWRRPEVKPAILLGLVMAGPLDTKYTAAVLLLGPGVGLLARLVYLLLARSSRARWPARQVLLAVCAFTLTALVATSPHWLKNAIFYGDPIYPLGRHVFPAHPWTAAAERLQQNFWNKGELWRPPATWAGLAESLGAPFNFSFIPSYFGRRPHTWIFFGSLFTLCTPLLVFVRPPARLWALCGSVLAAVFGWYWLHHQDRYLIALVPWMAAATVCTGHLVWRVHVVSRIGFGLLVAAQAIWGFDVYLTQTRWGDTVTLFASARKSLKPVRPSYRIVPGYEEIDARLPQQAVVLVHDTQPLLGLARKTVADGAPWQGGIDYGEALTDLGVYRQFRSVGVTHILWRTNVSQDWDSQAANLAFWGFVRRQGRAPFRVGSVSVAEMPRTAPAPSPKEPKVLVAICPGNYPTGIHALSALSIPGLDRTRPVFPKASTAVDTTQLEAVVSALAGVDYVLVNNACHPRLARSLAPGFVRMAVRGGDEQWVRK